MLDSCQKEKVTTLYKDMWVLYAVNFLEMAEEEAKLEWYRQHEKGKYVICEAREDNVTRLFIRNTSNVSSDIDSKSGWWNIFTVCQNPVEKGIWFCKATDFYLDRNGYLQMKVDPIRKADDVDFSDMFSFETNGTWKSPAWWFMAGRSRTFFTEYKFSLQSGEFHEPNIEALAKEHPELIQEGKDFGEAVLEAYLHNLITLKEIERCLLILSDFEALLLDIVRCWGCGTLELNYGSKYPLFCKKVVPFIESTSSTRLHVESVKEYIHRQQAVYQTWVRGGKIQALEEDDVLGEVEVVLLYREVVKRAEKEAKKAAKKAAKAVKEE